MAPALLDTASVLRGYDPLSGMGGAEQAAFCRCEEHGIRPISISISPPAKRAGNLSQISSTNPFAYKPFQFAFLIYLTILARVTR